MPPWTPWSTFDWWKADFCCGEEDNGDCICSCCWSSLNVLALSWLPLLTVAAVTAFGDLSGYVGLPALRLLSFLAELCEEFPLCWSSLSC